MQYRQTDLMPADLRSRTPFAQRLLKARNDARLTQKAVQAELGISQSTLSELERTANSSGYVAQLAALYGVDAHYLAEGVPTPTHTGVAHPTTQPIPNIELRRYRRSELMGADLKQPFELLVFDDALGPDIFKGCIARLHPYPARLPEPGKPVLVRDKEGLFHLLDYQSNGGSRWQAVPRAGRGYASLDSEEHGLELIAVMKGIEWP